MGPRATLQAQMIGHGGKVGGPPPGGAPPVVKGESQVPTPADKTAKDAGATKPAGGGDQFEAGRSRASGGAASSASAALGREASGTTNLLQLARNNPEAAKQLVASMGTQVKATLNEVEREIAAARQLVSKLAAEQFTKKAQDKLGAELKRQREKLAGLKLRQQVMSRRMALLQQIAGKLGDPKLDAEIDRILYRHAKLRTDWGKRHDLLSLGDNFFSATDDAPEHLREVVKTEVRGAGQGAELGDTLHELSPQRVIAELIARTIDGSTRAEVLSSEQARRGEFGRSIQNYAFLSELIEGSLARDPLARKTKKK